jgi:hypothetical protein
MQNKIIDDAISKITNLDQMTNFSKETSESA